MSVFENRDRRKQDDAEISRLFSKYGDLTPDEVKKRAADSSLSKRSQKHWKRIYRRMRLRMIFKAGTE